MNDQKSPRRIVMIEDDPQERDAMCAYVDTLDDFALVAVAAGSDEGLDLVRDHLPDVVILDLELDAGSGIDFLKRLPSIGIKKTPLIIVCTHNSSRLVHDIAHRLGADFIIDKYQSDYSPRTVINTARLILDESQRLNLRRSIDTIPPAQLQGRIRNRISAELNRLCFSTKRKGYGYLVEAILMAVESNDCSEITKRVASKLNLREPQVERAMQGAINAAWSKCPVDDLIAYYTGPVSPRTKTPSVVNFVCHYAQKIENEYT